MKVVKVRWRSPLPFLAVSPYQPFCFEWLVTLRSTSYRNKSTNVVVFTSPSSIHSIPKVGCLIWPRLGQVVATILSWQVLRMKVVHGIDDWVFVHDHLVVGSIVIWFTISFGIYLFGLAKTIDPPLDNYLGGGVGIPNNFHHIILSHQVL